MDYFYLVQRVSLSHIYYVQADQRTRIRWVGWGLIILKSLCSQSGHQTNRLVLDPSSKLPLYKHTGAKAPSPAKQNQGSGNQAKSQDSSAASGGQYCVYQKPKQVTCNVAHMKRVTNKYKYYCGARSRGKVCTGYRWEQLRISSLQGYKDVLWRYFYFYFLSVRS